MGKQRYVFLALFYPWVGLQKQVHPFSTQILLRCGSLMLVVVVLLVDQVFDQLVQSMRNSDPRVKIVFVHRLNSNFHSIFTVQLTGCDFQHGSFISRQSFRHVTDSANCKNSSVCFFRKYCPTSTVFRNPASVQISINRSGCGSLSTRSLYFCNKSSCAGI